MVSTALTDSEEGSARETTMTFNTHGEKRVAKPDPGSQLPVVVGQTDGATERQRGRDARRQCRSILGPKRWGSPKYSACTIALWHCSVGVENAARSWDGTGLIKTVP
ncbi:unnamed protein product [Arctogadus glacialis]